MLEERARIARELHDSVSQTLYAISLGASRASGLLRQNQGTEVQGLIEDVLQLAGAAQAELRALLTEIRCDALTSKGLIAALTGLATDVRMRHAIDIRLSCAEEPNVALATKNALLLIAREALHNVVRHSAAGRVEIVLLECADNLALLISDDGRGFDPTRPRPGHYGLQAMRERATLVGGTLHVLSAVGSGTQLRVHIPMSEQHG